MGIEMVIGMVIETVIETVRKVIETVSLRKVIETVREVQFRGCTDVRGGDRQRAAGRRGRLSLSEGQVKNQVKAARRIGDSIAAVDRALIHRRGTN